MSSPTEARSPAHFAAACRSSLSQFAMSGLVYSQVEMLARASSAEGADAETLKTFMLPLFGDGMISSVRSG